MSFNKKIWKRGDKLNIKELNRIEEGIATAGNDSSKNESIKIIRIDVTNDASKFDPKSEDDLTWAQGDNIYCSTEEFEALPSTTLVIIQLCYYMDDTKEVFDGSQVFLSGFNSDHNINILIEGEPALPLQLGLEDSILTLINLKSYYFG